MMQKDMKSLVAYSSVSHMGFVMLGMFALNPNGLNGSLLQQINHGISTGALFLIVGIIYDRRHTREIAEFGGLSSIMPKYAVIFAIMTMSSIGLPMLNGFIGEFTILMGALQENLWWAIAGASGIVLGAAYMLWLYQRTMFGKLDNPKKRRVKGFECEGTGDSDSTCDPGILDRHLSRTVLQGARWTGQQDR